MTVIIEYHCREQLTEAEAGRWRSVPVAIAVDVTDAACQIDPAIRPLRPAGQQPRLFGRAVTALSCLPISAPCCMRLTSSIRATCS